MIDETSRRNVLRAGLGLLAGIQLNIPRLFAALTLIALAGVAMFAATVALSKLALARWHESELPRDA